MLKLKKELKLRQYQEIALNTAAKYNTLVILPTGMGKTLIGLGLSIHRRKLGKTLFLTPTKPLAKQQQKKYAEYLGNTGLTTLTGNTPPKERKKLWEKNSFIFATPQTIENDLIRRNYDLRKVATLIIDEAHRAVGNYAYVFIAKQYMKQGENPRILGLTASPGYDEEKILEIKNNLFIRKIEVMTEEHPIVKPYVKKKRIIKVLISLPEEFSNIKKSLEQSLRTRLRTLRDKAIIPTSDITKVNKKKLLEAQKKLIQEIKSGSVEAYSLLSLNTSCIKVLHALEILQTQGIQSLRDYFKKIMNNTRTKANASLLKDVYFNKAMRLTLTTKEEHPKYKELINILRKERFDKAIIFSQYRNTTKRIVEKLNEYGFRAKEFIGQASKGMTQKQQKKVINEFKEGVYNVLVCTSVGEEGIDIPSVDVGVFFEPVPSALRTVQRRGRVGRTSFSKLFVLITRSTLDETYYWVSKHREAKMKKTLKKLQSKDYEKNKSQKKLNEFLSD